MGILKSNTTRRLTLSTSLMNKRSRDTTFLKACRGEPTTYTPIWLNRQAGRYMPEYRRVKGSNKSLDFFTNPELAAQVTLDAQRILGVDAAIVFADLLPMLKPMGLDLDYVAGIGPRFANPIRNPNDSAQIRRLVAEGDCGYIAQTIQYVIEDLPQDVSLIGFAGGPFTLAAYAIEGQGSAHFQNVRTFLYRFPSSWHDLLEKITDSVIDYVNLQIEAGADAVQIFDSWVGSLSTREYENFVAPYTQRLFNSIHATVPKIYFGTGNTHLLSAMYATGPDVLALDWRPRLVDVWDKVACPAIQGNMDPIALCASKEVVIEHAQRLLNDVAQRPGHIFNLGHGISPNTPVDNVKYLVDFVKSQNFT